MIAGTLSKWNACKSWQHDERENNFLKKSIVDVMSSNIDLASKNCNQVTLEASQEEAKLLQVFKTVLKGKGQTNLSFYVKVTKQSTRGSAWIEFKTMGTRTDREKASKKKENEVNAQILNDMLQIPENKMCSECLSKGSIFSLFFL